MFFLGASVNIIFYGLVSAILMICCQQTGREFIKDSLENPMRIKEMQTFTHLSAEYEDALQLFTNEIFNCNDVKSGIVFDSCFIFDEPKIKHQYPIVMLRYIAEVIYLNHFRAPPHNV